MVILCHDASRFGVRTGGPGKTGTCFDAKLALSGTDSSKNRLQKYVILCRHHT